MNNKHVDTVDAVLMHADPIVVKIEVTTASGKPLFDSTWVVLTKPAVALNEYRLEATVDELMAAWVLEEAVEAVYNCIERPLLPERSFELNDLIGVANYTQALALGHPKTEARCIEFLLNKVRKMADDRDSMRCTAWLLTIQGNIDRATSLFMHVASRAV